jgi:glycerophosphoryl diester phosphodiesterase
MQNRAMRRIGHRGAMGHAPENTIASFQKALDLACDEVETDVWLTQDGRLLVSHDRPTAKTTLSLDEVLDFCRGRMAVNLELKAEKDEARARETGARVAAHLAARGKGDAYVSSFWWSALEGARKEAPIVRRAFLFSDSPDRAALLASARAQGLWALHPNRAYVTLDLVRAAHGASLRVNAWTVNDPKEITTFRNWSVDGIMSDYPERVPKE